MPFKISCSKTMCYVARIYSDVSGGEGIVRELDTASFGVSNGSRFFQRQRGPSGKRANPFDDRDDEVVGPTPESCDVQSVAK